MKRAFLILGAQRSGTSVISHVLSQFGIDFGQPERFLQAGHNPIFFELKWVNDDNDQLTRCLGHQYIDFFWPIETDFDTPTIQTLEAQITDHITAEWGHTSSIGLKDPRFSLTFPVWQRALRQLGYQLQVIFAFRCPAGFLASNRKLFHQWPGWTDQRHLNFWLQFNLAAIYFTRQHHPFWLDYDQLMANPEPEITALAQCFNLDPAAIAQATSVIQPTQYHHSAGVETGVPLIDHYYQRLRSREVTAADYLQLRQQFLSVEFASSHPPS
jgi:hypothetical protein